MVVSDTTTSSDGSHGMVSKRAAQKAYQDSTWFADVLYTMDDVNKFLFYSSENGAAATVDRKKSKARKSQFRWSCQDADNILYEVPTHSKERRGDKDISACRDVGREERDDEDLIAEKSSVSGKSNSKTSTERTIEEQQDELRQSKLLDKVKADGVQEASQEQRALAPAVQDKLTRMLSSKQNTKELADGGITKSIGAGSESKRAAVADEKPCPTEEAGNTGSKQGATPTSVKSKTLKEPVGSELREEKTSSDARSVRSKVSRRSIQSKSSKQSMQNSRSQNDKASSDERSVRSKKSKQGLTSSRIQKESDARSIRSKSSKKSVKGSRTPWEKTASDSRSVRSKSSRHSAKSSKSLVLSHQGKNITTSVSTPNLEISSVDHETQLSSHRRLSEEIKLSKATTNSSDATGESRVLTEGEAHSSTQERIALDAQSHGIEGNGKKSGKISKAHESTAGAETCKSTAGEELVPRPKDGTKPKSNTAREASLAPLPQASHLDVSPDEKDTFVIHELPSFLGIVSAASSILGIPTFQQEFDETNGAVDQFDTASKSSIVDAESVCTGAGKCDKLQQLPNSSAQNIDIPAQSSLQGNRNAPGSIKDTRISPAPDEARTVDTNCNRRNVQSDAEKCLEPSLSPEHEDSSVHVLRQMASVPLAAEDGDADSEEEAEQSGGESSHEWKEQVTDQFIAAEEMFGPCIRSTSGDSESYVKISVFSSVFEEESKPGEYPNVTGLKDPVASKVRAKEKGSPWSSRDEKQFSRAGASTEEAAKYQAGKGQVAGKAYATKLTDATSHPTGRVGSKGHSPQKVTVFTVQCEERLDVETVAVSSAGTTVTHVCEGSLATGEKTNRSKVTKSSHAPKINTDAIAGTDAVAPEISESKVTLAQEKRNKAGGQSRSALGVADQPEKAECSEVVPPPRVSRFQKVASSMNPFTGITKSKVSTPQAHRGASAKKFSQPRRSRKEHKGSGGSVATSKSVSSKKSKLFAVFSRRNSRQTKTAKVHNDAVSVLTYPSFTTSQKAPSEVSHNTVSEMTGNTGWNTGGKLLDKELQDILSLSQACMSEASTSSPRGGVSTILQGGADGVSFSFDENDLRLITSPSSSTTEKYSIVRPR